MAPSREKVIQTAERFVARGKVEAAIREYRKVLADNPRDTNTLNRVGDLYARIERIDEAISLFTTIAEHYTDDGFFVKAIAIYKKIIKLDPTRLEIYERLAELYHRQGLVNEARTQYQVLADYYQKHGDLDAAVGICRRMLELEPSNPSHRAKLADLFQQQGKVSEAMAEYRTIAEQMLATDQPEAAARVYEKALEVSAADVVFLTDAVMALQQAGELAAAKRLAAAAAQKNPRNEQLARLLRPAREEPAADEVGGDDEASRQAPPSEVASLEPLLVEGEGFEEALEGLSPEIREAYADVPGPEEGDEPAAAAAPPGEEGERVGFDLEMDEVFVFDLEDDEPPASLVQPPPDMLDQPPGATFGRYPAAAAEEAAEELDTAAEVAEAPPAEIEEPLLEQAEEAQSGAAEMAAEEAAEAVSPSPPPAEPEFEVSLADLEEEVVFEVEDAAAEAAEGVQIDADLLERTAAEVTPSRPVQEEDDLLTEAEVLIKYGLHDKALERLRDVLGLNPKSLPAYALEISLRLDDQAYDRVAVLAKEMAGIAHDLDREEAWTPVRERLLRSGFELAGDRIVAIPEPATGDVPETAAEALEEEAPPAEAGPVGAEEVLVLDLEEEAPPAAEEEAAAGPAEEEAFVLDLEEEAFLIEDLEAPPADEAAAAAEPVAAEVETAAAAEEEPAPEIEAGAFVLEEIEEETPPAEAVAAELTEEETPPAEEDAETAEREALALEEVGEETPPPAVRRPAPPPRKEQLGDIDATLAEIASQVLSQSRRSRPAPAKKEQPPAAAAETAQPPAAAAPAAGAAASEATAAEELRKTSPELAEGVWEETPPPSVVEGAEPMLEESGIDWLDDMVPAAADEAAAAPEQLFDSEEGFFDLAAELEKELQGEEGFGGEGLFSHPQEQSLEEIVEGFKRGVAEHLSAEDYETHFNLGIAYREMGLLDEAIGEFQLAAKDPERLVDCCSMLGMCFLDKGLPELAIKWYRRGLESPGLPEEDSLALLYDLGNVYLALGEQEQAYKTFVDIYGVNTNYRDVVAKLEELAH